MVKRTKGLRFIRFRFNSFAERDPPARLGYTGLEFMVKGLKVYGL